MIPTSARRISKIESVGADRSWDPTSFLTGALVGAAVGAALALLFAPGAGKDTRRLMRRRARALTRDAAEGLGLGRR